MAGILSYKYIFQLVGGGVLPALIIYKIEKFIR